MITNNPASYIDISIAKQTQLMGNILHAGDNFWF